MREYKITKSILWRIVYKKRERDWIVYLWFLWPHGRGLNRTYARTFYNKEDAVSALVIQRHKDGKAD